MKLYIVIRSGCVTNLYLDNRVIVEEPQCLIVDLDDRDIGEECPVQEMSWEPLSDADQDVIASVEAIA